MSGRASAGLWGDLRSTTSGAALSTHHKTHRHQGKSTGTAFLAGVTVVSGAAVTTSLEDVIENRGGGVFVQQQLGWKNRRFLTGALRADDNSAFGANYNLVTYPNVSASWVLNEERF